jgi:hypothetical protein
MVEMMIMVMNVVLCLINKFKIFKSNHHFNNKIIMKLNAMRILIRRMRIVNRRMRLVNRRI